MAINFNELDFEVLDANVNTTPDIFINQSCVTFTKKVVDDLNYPAFIICQIDPKNRVFAIRMCKSNEPRGFKFSKPRNEQKSTVSISSKVLLEPIRQLLGDKCPPDKRYKVKGFWVTEAKTMCFDMNEATQEVFRIIPDDESAEA